jgi:hypothetical protein
VCAITAAAICTSDGRNRCAHPLRGARKPRL